MKRLVTLLFVLALSGCAFLSPAKPKPEIVYVPKEVKVEVPVKCDKPQVAKPDTPFDSASKTDLLYNNLAKLGAENQNLSAYTIKLESALDACSK